MVIMILSNIELREMCIFDVTKKTLRYRSLAPFKAEATMPSTKYILVVAA